MNKKPHQNALMVSPKTTCRSLSIPPLGPRLLTHPLRLNRSRPQLPQPETCRQAVTEIRAVYQVCRQFLSLTPAIFRDHLAKKLEDLPLTEESRQELLTEL